MSRWTLFLVSCLAFGLVGSCTSDETVPFTLSIEKSADCVSVSEFQLVVQSEGVKLWDAGSALSGTVYTEEISDSGSGTLTGIFYLKFTPDSGQATLMYQLSFDPSQAGELKLSLNCATMPPVVSATLDGAAVEVKQPGGGDDDDDTTDGDTDGDFEQEGNECLAGTIQCIGGSSPVFYCDNGYNRFFACQAACAYLTDAMTTAGLIPSCCDCQTVQPDGDTETDGDVDGDTDGDEDGDGEGEPTCGSSENPPSSVFFQAEDRFDDQESVPWGEVILAESDSSTVSGQYVLLRSSCSDDLEEIVINFTIDREFKYNFNIDYVQCHDWGQVQVFVDDNTEALELLEPVFEDKTLLSLHTPTCPDDSGAYAKKNNLYKSICLASGNHKLRMRVQGHEAMSTGCRIGVDYIKIQADY